MIRVRISDLGIVGVVILTLVLARLTWQDHQAIGGEPIALLAGISIWPSTWLRYAATILSTVLICKGVVDLNRNRDAICAEYLRLGPNDSQSLWARAHWPAGQLWDLNSLVARLRCLCLSSHPLSTDEGPLHHLCGAYFNRGHLWRRVVRVAVLAGAYVVFSLLIFQMAEFPNVPARGELAYLMSWLIAVIAATSMVSLAMFVLDATQLCRRFVQQLAEETFPWPDPASRRAAKEPDDLRELLTVEVIAARTEAVGKLTLYPFMIALLMIFARSSLIDYMVFSVELVTIIGILLVAVALVFLALRRQAEEARRIVLGRLRNRMASALGDGNTGRIEQLKQLIGEIEQEQRGAFRPLLKDYLFRALAIPFGGAGTLALIEQLVS